MAEGVVLNKELLASVEKLGLSDWDQTVLLLTSIGLKPVSEITITLPEPAGTEPEQAQHIQETVHALSDLGFVVTPVRMEDQIHFFIGFDATKVTRLSEIMFGDHDAEVGEEKGLLLGFPPTAARAYHESTLPEEKRKNKTPIIPQSKLPQEIREQDYMAFAGFIFSTEHWQEELVTVRKWATAILHMNPVLYERMVMEYRSTQSR